MARLGVFGSSFNPPTLAHAILLHEARWQLELERIIIVPTGDPWHKDDTGLISAETRLALAKAAFGGLEGFEVTSSEVDRPGPSYTCETLEGIHDANPQSQLVFISGSDAAASLRDWHQPERVLELASFAVASRGGEARNEVSGVFSSLGFADRLEFFEMPRIEVSSTLVRERIDSGNPWQHLVPTNTAEMIDNEGLYGS